MERQVNKSQEVLSIGVFEDNVTETDLLSVKGVFENDIFSNYEHLLSYYAIQAEDFRMRHTAIWTEVQHYTWVLSVLLGVGPLAAISQQSLDTLQLGFLLFLPLLGVSIAVLAYFIIKRDFLYYTQVDSRLLYIEKRLGVVVRPDYVDSRLARAQRPNFSVMQDVKEQNAIGLRALIKPKIRALVLFSFMLYSVAGVMEVAYFIFLIFL